MFYHFAASSDLLQQGFIPSGPICARLASRLTPQHDDDYRIRAQNLENVHVLRLFRASSPPVVHSAAACQCVVSDMVLILHRFRYLVS